MTKLPMDLKENLKEWLLQFILERGGKTHPLTIKCFLPDDLRRKIESTTAGSYDARLRAYNKFINDRLFELMSEGKISYVKSPISDQQRWWVPPDYPKSIKLDERKAADELAGEVRTLRGSVHLLQMRVEDWAQKIEKLEAFLQKIRELEPALKLLERTTEAVENLHRKLARLSIKYPGLAGDLGFELDGLPQLLATKRRVLEEAKARKKG